MPCFFMPKSKFIGELKMKKFILFTFVLTMMISLTACGEDENSTTEPATEQITQQSSEAPEITGITTELTVWGMTCQKCVNKITGAVSELDGIINVSVDLDDEKVTVEHEPDVDVDEIKLTIRNEGFSLD
jgi:copper ion binding protein